MVGFYNYTVYMTYLGFVSGVTGIIFSFGLLSAYNSANSKRVLKSDRGDNH